MKHHCIGTLSAALPSLLMFCCCSASLQMQFQNKLLSTPKKSGQEALMSKWQSRSFVSMIFECVLIGHPCGSGMIMFGQLKLLSNGQKVVIVVKPKPNQ